MNTVLNSYGQLCGCPEILKKSCKFFVVGLAYGCLQCYFWQFILVCLIVYAYNLFKDWIGYNKLDRFFKGKYNKTKRKEVID